MCSHSATIWCASILLLHGIASSIVDNNNEQQLDKLLTNDRLQFKDMITSYIPITELWQDIWHNVQLSTQEKYDSIAKYPPKMALNSLIGSMEDDVEVILSENDLELTAQLVEGFEREVKPTLNDVDMNRYWKFVNEMRGNYDEERKEKRKKPSPYNMNGASSDYRYLSSSTPSTGINGEYWAVSDECIKHKGCNVYPIFRVIHKTKRFSVHDEYISFSCNDILTLLLPQVFDCVDQYGVRKCPLIIDSGHFRWVFKAKIPGFDDAFVAIKMMKQTSSETSRDLLRHLRESIFLYYLRNEELQYIAQHPNHTFVSNLDERRAFPYVYELGHCIYPSYISVSHFYNVTMEQYIKEYAPQANLSQLLAISVQIAQGIQVLHNIAGGPYHHTDIREDQYMMDQYGNVLINDFNRGKFQPYFFAKHDYNMDNINANVEKCNFCPHQSHGNIRAPEEQISQNLDETIDIYSAAFVIWKLFATASPFGKVAAHDIQYLVYDTARRPPMPSNMPYAMKAIIQSALSQNPKDRPNAREFSKLIQDIYDNIHQYTRDKQHFTSYYARKHKIFRDRHYPRVSSQFPEFLTKSGES